MSLLTDKQLELIAQEEEFLLFCDTDEFKQIALHIEAIVCRELRQQLAEANHAHEFMSQQYAALQNQLTSRDAEVERLNQHFAEVSECHGIDLRERDAAIKSWTEKNRQLTEHVTLLRDELTTVYKLVPDLLVLMKSSALAATDNRHE